MTTPVPNKKGGLRYGTDEGKPRFSLLSAWAQEGLARISTYGAKKYTKYGQCTCTLSLNHSATCESRKVINSGDWNWAKGLSWAETIDSLERHLNAFKKGEELDDGPGGSGLPHIDHLQWNAMALSHFQKTSTGTDDRWKNEVEQIEMTLTEAAELPFSFYEVCTRCSLVAVLSDGLCRNCFDPNSETNLKKAKKPSRKVLKRSRDPGNLLK